MAALAGRLVLIGTPIGNLGDLSPRAEQALRDADVVACEDTRHTRKLLSARNIATRRVIAVHDHNEAAQVRTVLKMLDEGQTVAVVSDAGMPGISDPGERLVAAAANAGHTVEVVPGPTALIAGLVASGMATGRFVFEGFLPRKGGDRTSRLAAIAAERRTIVLYEAPHRVVQLVEDLAAVCDPLRRVAIARELTKIHEEVWRGSLVRAVEHLAAHPPRGEHVVVLDGAAAPAGATDEDIAAALARHLDAGDDKKAAIAAVATQLDVPKRRVYDLAVARPPAGDPVTPEG